MYHVGTRALTSWRIQLREADGSRQRLRVSLYIFRGIYSYSSPHQEKKILRRSRGINQHTKNGGVIWFVGWFPNNIIVRFYPIGLFTLSSGIPITPFRESQNMQKSRKKIRKLDKSWRQKEKRKKSTGIGYYTTIYTPPKKMWIK